MSCDQVLAHSRTLSQLAIWPGARPGSFASRVTVLSRSDGVDPEVPVDVDGVELRVGGDGVGVALELGDLGLGDGDRRAFQLNDEVLSAVSAAPLLGEHEIDDSARAIGPAHGCYCPSVGGLAQGGGWRCGVREPRPGCGRLPAACIRRRRPTAPFPGSCEAPCVPSRTCWSPGRMPSPGTRQGSPAEGEDRVGLDQFRYRRADEQPGEVVLLSLGQRHEVIQDPRHGTRLIRYGDS